MPNINILTDITKNKINICYYLHLYIKRDLNKNSPVDFFILIINAKGIYNNSFLN